MAYRGTSVTVPDPNLSGIMVQRMYNETAFAWQHLMPPLLTRQSAGPFYKYDKARAHTVYETKKIRGAAANHAMGEITQDSFICAQHMFRSPIDRGDAAQFSDYFSLRNLAIEDVRANLNRVIERDFINTIINNTNFPLSGNTGLTVAATWNGASGTPIADMNTAREAFRARGVEPGNNLVLTVSQKCFDGLGSNPEIVNRVKYTYGGVIEGVLPVAAIESALGIKKLVIEGSRINTANDGATASFSSQLGVGDAFLAIVDNGPDTRPWQMGRTFMWTGKTGTGIAASEYPDDNVDADWVQAEWWWQLKLMSTDCGFRFASVAA